MYYPPYTNLFKYIKNILLIKTRNFPRYFINYKKSPYSHTHSINDKTYEQ